MQARASWRKAFPVFFSSHSPFSLDSSSFPLTGPTQETDQNWQADIPMRGASHSYTQMGMSREKLQAGWGIPQCACGDADTWGGMWLTHGLTALWWQGWDSNPCPLIHNTLYTVLLLINRIWDLVWEWLQLQDPWQGSRISLMISTEPERVLHMHRRWPQLSREGCVSRVTPGPMLPSDLAVRLANTHPQSHRQAWGHKQPPINFPEIYDHNHHHIQNDRTSLELGGCNFEVTDWNEWPNPLPSAFSQGLLLSAPIPSQMCTPSRNRPRAVHECPKSSTHNQITLRVRVLRKPAWFIIHMTTHIHSESRSLKVIP